METVKVGRKFQAVRIAVYMADFVWTVVNKQKCGVEMMGVCAQGYCDQGHIKQGQYWDCAVVARAEAGCCRRFLALPVQYR